MINLVANKPSSDKLRAGNSAARACKRTSAATFKTSSHHPPPARHIPMWLANRKLLMLGVELRVTAGRVAVVAMMAVVAPIVWVW